MQVSSHRLKLNRALGHLYALEAATQGWSETEPVVIVRQCEVKTRKYSLRPRVFEQPADPSIPLLIGDCVHCLRQGLDHLAYALAIIVSGTNPPPNWENTQFPITSSPEAFQGGLPNKIGRKKLMPEGLYDVLEGIQPYHGGDRELLGVLHGLDNIDKHRFVPVVAAVGSIPTLRIGQMVGSEMSLRVGPIEDNEPFLEFIPDDEADQKFEWDFAASIAFDKGSPVAGGQLVIALLRSIRQFIMAEVLPPLEVFL